MTRLPRILLSLGIWISMPAVAGELPAFSITWGVFGSGPGEFEWPTGIATDPQGFVYVADTFNDRVQKFSAEGEYNLEWGSRGSGNGQFDGPFAIATDENANVYVSDGGRIQVFSSDGTYLRSIGSVGSSGDQIGFLVGIGVASGNVYGLDQGHARVLKYSAAGDLVGAWGAYGNPLGRFELATAITTDRSGFVYILDESEPPYFRIQRFTGDGEFVNEWGSASGTAAGFFDRPRGLSVDGNDRVYVAEHGNSRIQVFTMAGEWVGMWGSRGTGEGQFGPWGIATGQGEAIYVVDRENHRIQRFSYQTTTKMITWGLIKIKYIN